MPGASGSWAYVDPFEIDGAQGAGPWPLDPYEIDGAQTSSGAPPSMSFLAYIDAGAGLATYMSLFGAIKANAEFVYHSLTGKSLYDDLVSGAIDNASDATVRKTAAAAVDTAVAAYNRAANGISTTLDEMISAAGNLLGSTLKTVAIVAGVGLLLALVVLKG